MDAWESILEEYVSLIKTDKTDNIFLLLKKIRQTEWHMALIEQCLGLLKIEYRPNTAAILNSRGFGEVAVSDDREVYLRSLYAIETSAKTLVVLLNQYKAEYQLISKESAPIEESASDKRFRFAKELAMLSKYQGQRIIPEKITVMDYCAIINNYLEEQKPAVKKEAADGK